MARVNGYRGTHFASMPISFNMNIRLRCLLLMIVSSISSVGVARASAARSRSASFSPGPSTETSTETSSETSTGHSSSASIASTLESVLRIAAASDLRFALDELRATAEKQLVSTHIEIIYGSSGQLAQQIEAGAPFDVFLSADASFAKRVEEAHFAAGPIFQYGTGRLVIWSLKDTKINWEPTLGLLLLKDPSILKISMANPQHAPYGTLAETALQHAGIFDELKARLVTADGVSQAAQFAEVGATSVGLISESLALSPEMASRGHFFRVDEKLAAPLAASGLIIAKSKNEAAAIRFRDILLSRAGQRILEKFGLALRK